jgi:hypothetical protein
MRLQSAPPLSGQPSAPPIFRNGQQSGHVGSLAPHRKVRTKQLVYMSTQHCKVQFNKKIKTWNCKIHVLDVIYDYLTVLFRISETKQSKAHGRSRYSRV